MLYVSLGFRRLTNGWKSWNKLLLKCKILENYQHPAGSQMPHRLCCEGEGVVNVKGGWMSSRDPDEPDGSDEHLIRRTGHCIRSYSGPTRAQILQIAAAQGDVTVKRSYKLALGFPFSEILARLLSKYIWFVFFVFFLLSKIVFMFLKPTFIKKNYKICSRYILFKVVLL